MNYFEVNSSLEIVLTLSGRVQEKEYADAISILYCGYATASIPLFQPLLCSNGDEERTHNFFPKDEENPNHVGPKG